MLIGIITNESAMLVTGVTNPVLIVVVYDETRVKDLALVTDAIEKTLFA